MDTLNAIQGIYPLHQQSATDTGHYCRLVAEAAAEGIPIADYGFACGGVGHAPPSEHIQIKPPIGVLDHSVDDLTLCVSGGTTLDQIQAFLSPTNQRLPIDGMGLDQTIAEIISHNLFGPRRLTHGSMRDLLLGLTYINHKGEAVSVGGRTVKNVAGYDATRLMVGSLNTLGLIAEATLRTAPIPMATESLVVDNINPSEIDDQITSLICDDGRPDGLWVFFQNSQAQLHLIYEDSPEACAIRIEAVRHWLAPFGISPRICERSEFSDQGIVRFQVRPGQTLEIAETLSRRMTDQTVEALPVFGTIWLRGPDLSVESALQLEQATNELLKEFETMTWWKRPDDSQKLNPFRTSASDQDLMTRLKQQMDPKGLFNPGRYP